MKMQALGRAIKSGATHFWRNIWLSLAATGVMVLTLAMLALIMVVSVLGQNILSGIESKVDITVFMAEDSAEAAIMAVKNDIEGLKQVSEVVYVSKEKSLSAFQEKHKNNPRIAQALTELGSNPMQAALVVKAENIEAYNAINESLKSPKYQRLIARVTYEDNSEIITRLSAVIKTARKVGMAITLALAVIAVLVTFNTIRLAIYGYHREIEIMTLVGASPWFIKGPFVIEGIISGFVASFFTILLLYPFLRIVSPGVGAFFVDNQFSIYQWANDNFVMVIALVGSAGILLGAISSIIAVQRYLKAQ
ncbi:MAG: permease-like cell division protein FtsX [bacterium]|nr:permease-like cell division protein FtsX [bacterium]